ncbi:MAG TPA: replication factor C large subunit [Thermoplasmata archaeon]|nr:replication factor C large subunit [Thermoplasmata archaeon]
MSEEWTEKYRPTSLSQVVGNDNAVRSMRRWAESWKNGTPKKKALALRGEPGTGKTSSALALANDYGWVVIEMNASDHRNADSIRRVAGVGSISQTFSESGEFLSTADGRRKLIVLDEADNLFGREDYGGAKAITETIRATDQPIILIVNDYYALTRKASAVKTLAEAVDFSRLSDKAVIRVLKGICSEESLDVDASVFEKVARNAGGDMRGAINDLQMLIEGRRSLGEGDAGALGQRNQEVELQIALGDMYEARSAKDARNATLDLDKTPDELILWVDESIPQEFKTSSEMAAAFDALSKADIYLRRTRTLQHYGLWSYAKEFMTAGVSLAREGGRRRTASRYGFPSYLIVMSRSKSIRASRKALCSKLSPVLHTSGKQVGSSMLPYLSAMAKRDPELLANMGAEAGLDEGDVAYLLGTDPASEEVGEAMTNIRRVSTGEGFHEKNEAGKSGGRRSRSLADF